jgi:hypothetical protein
MMVAHLSCKCASSRTMHLDLQHAQLCCHACVY